MYNTRHGQRHCRLSPRTAPARGWRPARRRLHAHALQHRRQPLPGDAARRADPQTRRRHAGRHRSWRRNAMRAAAAARRRQQPGRAERQRRAGDGHRALAGSGAGAERRGAVGACAAGACARYAQRPAQGSRAAIRPRPGVEQPRLSRRHRLQQRHGQPLDRLRHGGRPRAGDEGAARRRLAGALPPAQCGCRVAPAAAKGGARGRYLPPRGGAGG